MSWVELSWFVGQNSLASYPDIFTVLQTESTNQVRVSKEEIRLEEERAEAEANLNKTVNEEKLKVC